MELILFTKIFTGCSTDEVGSTAKKLGFDGLDLAVRRGQCIEPASARETLPAAIQMWRDMGISVPMLTLEGDLTDPDAEGVEAIYETCQASGVPLVKLGYWRWKPGDDYWQAVSSIRRNLGGFAKLGEKHGVCSLVHTHAGGHYGGNVSAARQLVEGFDFKPELHLAGMFPLFFHPRLLDIVESFLGSEIRLYPNYTVRPKFPEWAGHQVPTSMTVDKLRMVNMWTPLVPVNVENGCMQFIPGTHRMGAVPHEGRTHYLEIVQTTLAPLVDKAVDIVLDPGDVVLFHNMLFHQGLPNRSGKIRWSVDWRYQDATQPTLRAQQGHIARSRSHPETEVHNASEWASLSFT